MNLPDPAPRIVRASFAIALSFVALLSARATAAQTAQAQSAAKSADSTQRKSAPTQTKKAGPRDTSNNARPPRVNTDSIARAARARRDSIEHARWPVKGPDPLPGSLLPNKRIIAFYGNPLSKRMGVLGEYETEDMLRRLDAEVAAWAAADPSTPVVPALHLIAVVAQAGPGSDGMYRARMDSAMIEKVAGWSKKRNALVFLDIQVGLSTLQKELPRLAGFFSRPNFHLGIDPEFSMKNGGIPGKRIGTFDAVDINYATSFLNELVTKHNIPPKILVVHRFTKKGLTNYQNIKLDARTQIVIHMDGFGPPELKKGTFRHWIKSEPVQFAGWKQFFKPRNDNPRTTIAEILRLWPKVVYIQYQ